MKKISLLIDKLFITTLFILMFCLSVEANEFRYLYRNSFYCYDINSFNYNTNNIYSIDIIYDIHNKNHKHYKKIKSPYDNNFIQYIIFNVRFDTETNSYYTKYKGYVSGEWDMEGLTYLFKDANLYYEDNPKLTGLYEKYTKEFKKYANASSKKHYMNFPKDIVEIHEAQKNMSINKLDGLYKTLNAD